MFPPAERSGSMVGPQARDPYRTTPPAPTPPRLVWMRAPTGERKQVPVTAVDFFRKNGAVLLGEPDMQGPVEPMPPAPRQPYSAAADTPDPTAQPGGPGFWNNGRMTSPRLTLDGQEERYVDPRNPLGVPMLNALGTAATPSAMVAGGMGALVDQPSTAGTSVRTMAALKAMGQQSSAAPYQEQPLSLSQAMRDRGVDPGVVGGLGLDIAGDPTNFLGGGGDDLVRHAPLVMGAAFKGGKKAWRPLLEAVFAVRDDYGKLKGFMKPEKLVETMRAHPGATPDIIAATEKYAASLKGKPVRAGEVIDVLSKTDHDRGRVLYDMTTVPKDAKPLPGAPAWVTSPEKEAESLGGYLDLVLDGVGGRGFYRESGKAVLAHAGDDPERAYRVSGGLAITSPSTDVAGNTGHAVKGHAQAVAGMPIKTGMFPTAMSKTVKQVYDRVAGALGPKREPFVRQIAMGGNYATEEQKTTRAVHDFWEGEAFRYVNPDGTPKRAGFGPAQHAWMDKMTDAAIAQANETKLGGFDDWDAGTLQAAAWTGAKLRAGNLKPGQAAKSFADYLKRYYMQTGREVIAGKTAAHMPELAGNQAALDDYVTRVSEILYDPQGREKAAMAKDMLVGGSIEGPGIFQNTITPGRQVKQVVGTTGKPKAVDMASMKLAKANEAEYGMLMGQDAIAGTMLDPDALKGARDMFDLHLPSGKLGMNDPLLVQPDLKAAIAADKVAVIPIDEGVRILNLDMGSKEFDTFMRAQEKATQGKVIPGKNLGFYEGQKWNVPEGQAGQHYARLILDLPTGEAGFNKSAPGAAAKLNELDRYMNKTYGVTLNQSILDLREAIAANGMAGVRALAKQYGAPLAVLLALAQAHRMLPSSEGGA